MNGNAQTPPYMYDYQNEAVSQIQPGLIHCNDNSLYLYFVRYLLQKVLSLYEWKIPKTWDKNYFLFTLFLRGYVAVINTDKFGIIPQNCTLFGYNVMYQPTNVLIANPLLRGNLQPRIGKDCAMIRLMPDWGGIYDMVSYYANCFACLAESNLANLVNSKLAYVFFGANKAEAESFKKLYDSFASGHPAIVIDKKLMNDEGKPNWIMFTQNIGQNYIVDRNMEVFQQLEQLFNTDIGIPNINKYKKARMTTEEVQANDEETFSKCLLWLDELKESCECVNNMFGIGLSVKMRDFHGNLQINPDLQKWGD